MGPGKVCSGGAIMNIEKIRYCPHCQKDVDGLVEFLEDRVRQTCPICGQILGEAGAFAMGDMSAAGRKVPVEMEGKYDTRAGNSGDQCTISRRFTICRVRSNRTRVIGAGKTRSRRMADRMYRSIDTVCPAMSGARRRGVGCQKLHTLRRTWARPRWE